MGKKNEDWDWTPAMIALGYGIPLFIMFAPKKYRRGLVDYAGKFVGVLFLVAIAWFAWGIIKDKRRHKRDMQNNKRED